MVHVGSRCACCRNVSGEDAVFRRCAAAASNTSFVDTSLHQLHRCRRRCRLLLLQRRQTSRRDTAATAADDDDDVVVTSLTLSRVRACQPPSTVNEYGQRPQARGGSTKWELVSVLFPFPSVSFVIIITIERFNVAKIANIVLGPRQ